MSFLQDLKFLLRGERPTKQYIKMGMQVGTNFNREQGCLLDYPHCWLITIGNNVTLAPRVQILAHDASTKKYLGYTKIGRVTIKDNVFIGANTTILPNVTIEENVIIGANSVITKNIPANSVAVGNPAKVIMTTDEYLTKNQQMLNTHPTYDQSYTIWHNVTNEKKHEMYAALNNQIGYIE